jgi:translation elongation factor EF-G
LANLIEKKQSKVTYQIELTEDELQTILAIYGETHYDYYKDVVAKNDHIGISNQAYQELYNELWRMANDDVE